MTLFRWLVLPAILASLGFAAGWRVCGWRASAQAERAERRVVAVVQRQGAVTKAAAVANQAAQDRVRSITRTLIREVPTYVTPDVDRAFPLSVGFVRLLDAGALGRDLSAVPGPAGRADDQASPITPGDAATALIANDGECHADQTRLIALQDWVMAEARAGGAP